MPRAISKKAGSADGGDAVDEGVPRDQGSGMEEDRARAAKGNEEDEDKGGVRSPWGAAATASTSKKLYYPD